jgi:RNA polymerase sigma-70 factor, ECF subfamily
MTTPELVERARRGDRGAFDVLAAGAVDRLYAIARLVLRDADRAEDATQETLVRCWRDLPSLRDVGRFDGWLHRLLMNAINDEFRDRRRHAANIRILSVEPGVADESEALALRQELERAFTRLTLEHRAVLVLRLYLGLSIEETAATIGIPVGTCKSRLHYATEAMRLALEADARLPGREVSA